LLGLASSSIIFDPDLGLMSANARGEWEGPAPGVVGYLLLLLGVEGNFEESAPLKGAYFGSMVTAGLDREYECEDVLARGTDAGCVAMCGSVGGGGLVEVRVDEGEGGLEPRLA